MKRILFVFTLIIALVSCKTENKKEENKNIQKVEKMETKKIQVIGNKFKVDFGGDFIFQLDFENETQMTFKVLAEKDFGNSETVQTTRVEIRPNVYMVYWKEKSETTVTHLQDFENGIVYTNITTPDHSFYNMKGTLSKIAD